MSEDLYQNEVDRLIEDNASAIVNSSEPDEIVLVLLLKAMRIAVGMSQEDVASRLRSHQSNVSRFESPNYTGRTMRSIIRYADAIGAKIRFLVD